MSNKGTVVLAGTLDTKGPEYEFVKARILETGTDVIMVDTGVLGDPYFKPEICACEVAEAAGCKLEELRTGREGSDTRTVACTTMSKGLLKVIIRLIAEGKCDTVLGLGGSGGTTLLSMTFKELPLGLPKLIVSTVASGNTREYVGSSDLLMMNSVTDIAGLNRISAIILANAAHAAAGMAQNSMAAKKYASGSKPLIAMTMFGVTTPGVLRIREGLEKRGFDVIIFHAVGQGVGMEELIEAGVIDGLVDYTLPELINYKNGGIFSAGPDRMKTAGRKGIPQVIVPGAIECFNFGPISSIPEKYNVPERKVIVHNPTITSLLATGEELKELGEYVAERANEAKGPTAVLLPLLGLDKYQAEGSPWYGPEHNKPLYDSIRGNLNSSIELKELSNNINDADFADAALEMFLKVWEKR
ncbi:MAG: Tm-1-like ATP-binding domain-containing protein [Clostridia bacterium]